MLKNKLIKYIFAIILVFAFTRCTSVKGYQRAYLNDEEMQLGAKDCQHLENYFQIIREGASGAGGGKTGGGCGCN